jgi:hypothetical protein
MIVEVGSPRQAPAIRQVRSLRLLHNSRSGALRDEHGVVRTDLAVGAGEPADHVGLRRSAESVGSSRPEFVDTTIGQHERVPRELDHRLSSLDVGAKYLDSPID